MAAQNHDATYTATASAATDITFLAGAGTQLLCHQ